MTSRIHRADRVRFAANDFQNQVVDEFLAHRLDRRGFLRGATVVGFSAGAAALLAACGADDRTGTSAAPSTPGGAGRPGGQILAGCLTPGGAIDPLTLATAGGVCLMTQTAEYLSLSNGQPELRPVLATGWTPNADATQWTFDIRQGVTFSDGTPLTARDVAATFNRLADPASSATAYDVLEGVLSAGGATATDDSTVVFELEAPTGAFSWLVSSDLFGSLILPESFDGDWESTWIGTGPFVLESYARGERAQFKRNESYWGPAPLPDTVDFTLFEDDAAMVLALQSKSIEVINTVSYVNGRAVVEDTASFTTQVLQTSAHRFWSIRTDVAPLDDARVRRAIALGIDREALTSQLMGGHADVGNDSPFAPVFPMTSPDVAQRSQDLDQARSLLAQAGYDGAAIDLVVQDVHEVAQLGQVVQSSLADIGVEINLQVLDSTTFSGDGRLGASPGMDAPMSINSWGSRGVPNAFLGAQLRSGAGSNSPRFENAEYDQLVSQFTATADLQSQQQIAGQIQDLLLEETPAIYAYFVNWLSASLPTVSGTEFTAMGSLLLHQAQHTD